MKVLLTNAWMNNLGGSELVTLELAEEFQRQGHEVLIYSPQHGAGPLEITVPITSRRPDTKSFDLLWIHHNMIIHDLGFKKRFSQRMVFNHMSSYVGTEFPKLPGYEQHIADIILANSFETKIELEHCGLKGVQLFQNPAPSEWDGVDCSGDGLLIVTNHEPVELNAIKADRIGGNKMRRLTRDELTKYKAVICNGKTVQYALRAGVPVYLYDQFGGPGWLDVENFAIAERFNFSGRGFGYESEFLLQGIKHRAVVNRKTTGQIDQELSLVPKPLTCFDRFKLENRLKELEIC